MPRLHFAFPPEVNSTGGDLPANIRPSEMSRQQLMNMYQRQIALGGMSSGGDGGIFSAQAKEGLQEYRLWHAQYKQMYPAANREELKAAWRLHKMGASGSSLVGGYSDMTPMRGMALSGGARMPKGVRHCMEEVMEPSGVRRCAKYMPGPRGMHGMALSGGFPGQRDVFSAWAAKSQVCRGPNRRETSAAHKMARAAASSKGSDFKEGAKAAAEALGVSLSAAQIAKLKKARPSRARAPAAAAPALMEREAPQAFSLENVYPAERIEQIAQQAQQQISDAELEGILGLGGRARRRGGQVRLRRA